MGLVAAVQSALNMISISGDLEANCHHFILYIISNDSRRKRLKLGI